ncbi:c-type cytochrome [Mucilaginibacter aquatilis]|uniref:Photosynthetic reaction center cytochrome c subunit n=1 Tax=Mucilaginibacter aquatilis TaxID=1517760 RepID=A0A6I4I783_9SPHI|nr:c-type cytochrome [Mucilaginibacter aquatilis]MVN91030.1 c-type cytochrome [Mucilaginibacter aquatilis]
MTIKKNFVVALGMLASVVFISTTAMQTEKVQDEKKFKNLKVLPKNISEKQLDGVMDEWAAALGVRCNFCHTRNEETKRMDFALDSKPEKEMARKMYRMTATINKKYFDAGKDSIGRVMELGVNCNTCHKGSSHPELKAAYVPRARRPQTPPPAQQPAPAPVQN